LNSWLVRQPHERRTQVSRNSAVSLNSQKKEANIARKVTNGKIFINEKMSLFCVKMVYFIAKEKTERMKPV